MTLRLRRLCGRACCLFKFSSRPMFTLFSKHDVSPSLEPHSLPRCRLQAYVPRHPHPRPPMRAPAPFFRTRLPIPSSSLACLLATLGAMVVIAVWAQECTVVVVVCTAVVCVFAVSGDIQALAARSSTRVKHSLTRLWNKLTSLTTSDQRSVTRDQLSLRLLPIHPFHNRRVIHTQVHMLYVALR
jgi:hypothetical protein